MWPVDNKGQLTKLENVRKAQDNIMGGNVIEFEWEKSYKEYNNGKVNELVGLVHDNILTLEVAESRAKNLYGVEADDFEKLLKNYSSEETLKQG